MKKVKLGEVCEILNGFAFKSLLYVNEGIRIIRITNVQKGYIEDSDPKYYPIEYRNSIEKYILKENDLLMSLTGNVGRVGLISKTMLPAALNQRVACLRTIDSLISKEYVFQFLNSDLFEQSAIRSSNGVAQKNLSTDWLKKVEITYPSVEQQKLITSTLNLIERLICCRKEQNKKLNELVKSRFNEMFGDPILNDMGWEVTKLGELTNKISSGNTPKGGSQVYVDKGIMFFRSQNVWKNKILLDDIAYIDDQTNRNMKDTILEHGDLLITKTGRVNTENSSLGRTAQYLGQSGKANINGHVYLVRINSDISKRFILEILISNAYRDYIRRICVGGIDKRQLNKNHIEDFPIILPPLSLQNEFADFVAQIDKSQFACQKAIKLWRNSLKSSII